MGIPNCRADYVAKHLEFQWLSLCPWPTEIIMDRGKEFAAKVQDTIHNHCAIKWKLITTHNPQANTMVEQIHQVIHNMTWTACVTSESDLNEDFRWDGMVPHFWNDEGRCLLLPIGDRH